ncbi:MAG: hypothetical protein JXK94_03720 [Deltaproteobacteria bacterium]|nr:hypothetical protein [Deltaproteobacteria bacterium]
MGNLVFLLLTLIALQGCVLTTPPLKLEENCRTAFPGPELAENQWLAQDKTWRLRQAALLEIGPREIPLEGFLRLDLKNREARLVAMNELGLVLFDLQVSISDEKLQRVVPQLRKRKELAKGIGQSLRRIFLLPRPRPGDQLENFANSQRLWRSVPDGRLQFVFDCSGDLRETRKKTNSENWRVLYDSYRLMENSRLPMKIVMNDYRRNVKLSIWLHEAKTEL